MLPAGVAVPSAVFRLRCVHAHVAGHGFASLTGCNVVANARRRWSPEPGAVLEPGAVGGGVSGGHGVGFGSLAGRNALVTGVSEGSMGHGIANALARQGCQVSGGGYKVMFPAGRAAQTTLYTDNP